MKNILSLAAVAAVLAPTVSAVSVPDGGATAGFMLISVLTLAGIRAVLKRK